MAGQTHRIATIHASILFNETASVEFLRDRLISAPLLRVRVIYLKRFFPHLLAFCVLSLFLGKNALALSSGNVAGFYNASETATVTLTAEGESETEEFSGTNSNVQIIQSSSQFSFTISEPSSGISVTRTGTVSGNTISNLTGPIIAFRSVSGLKVNQNRITSSSGHIYQDRFTLHVVGYATGTYDGVAWRADVVSDSVFYSTAPLVTTGGASAIAATTVTISATVNPQGYPTTARFEYGLTSAYGSSAIVTLSPANGYTAQQVSAALSGLQAGKIYHYRIAASSSRGSSFGEDATFTLDKTLSLTISGSGGGSVYGTVGTDSILSCHYPPQHGTCSAPLTGIATVNLSVIPDSNSVFGDWGIQCGSCSGRSCTVTVDDNKNCTVLLTEADRVRILSTAYQTLTSAFADSTKGDIRARAVEFTEGPVVSLPTVLKGGFNADFTSNSGNFSTLRGTLIIGSGSLNLEGLIIGP